MEYDRLIEKLNTASNILDSVTRELIKQSKTASADKKEEQTKLLDDITKPLEVMSNLNKELTVKQCLEKYGQPTDDEHIESVCRIVDTNTITLEQLDSCLERVKYANDKNPKNDIRKYTYTCLYKVNSKA